jgi:hypothetical protein
LGQVPGIGQRDGQHLAAQPGERAGDPGGDLPGLTGQPDRFVVIAGMIGVETNAVLSTRRDRWAPAIHVAATAVITAVVGGASERGERAFLATTETATCAATIGRTRWW